MRTATHNTSDTHLAHTPRNAHLLDLDVAFARLMEADIARRNGVGSPEHRAAVHCLQAAEQAAA